MAESEHELLYQDISEELAFERRQQERVRKSVDLLLAATLCSPEQTLLDIRAESGQYVRELQRRNFSHIVGFDIGRPLLLDGKQDITADGENAEFVEGNWLNLPFSNAFNVVYGIHTSIGKMSREEENREQSVFNAIAKIVKPGGKIFLGCSVADNATTLYKQFGTQIQGSLYRLPTYFPHPDTRDYCEIEWYDFATQMVSTETQWFNEEKELQIAHIAHRSYTTQQYREMLAQTGFRLEEIPKWEEYGIDIHTDLKRATAFGALVAIKE